MQWLPINWHGMSFPIVQYAFVVCTDSTRWLTFHLRIVRLTTIPLQTMNWLCGNCLPHWGWIGVCLLWWGLHNLLVPYWISIFQCRVRQSRLRVFYRIIVRRLTCNSWLVPTMGSWHIAMLCLLQTGRWSWIILSTDSISWCRQSECGWRIGISTTPGWAPPSRTVWDWMQMWIWGMAIQQCHSYVWIYKVYSIYMYILSWSNPSYR